MAYEERGGRPTEDNHDFTGYQVYDMHYEKIGKVDDVFVGENDDPEYIGVKVGLLGTKTALIPIGIVRANDKRQLVEVAANKDAIEEGPTFGDDREITPEFQRRVFGHYGVEGTRGSEQGGVPSESYPDAASDERVDLRPGERAEAQRAGGSEQRSSERRPGERRSHEERPASAARGGVDRERGSGPGGEDELRVQRVEEELRAGTGEREAGAMRVRKRVRTDRERLAVPKKREEVRVERVPVEGRRGETPEAEIGEDEIWIPVVEEEVVVEKRPVVKEEIKVRKDVVEEEEVVEENVRKEEVEIDDQTERGGRPGGVAGRGGTNRDDRTGRRGR